MGWECLAPEANVWKWVNIEDTLGVWTGIGKDTNLGSAN